MLRGHFEAAQAEMADAAGATTVAAQEQINQLVAEREAWIEEVQAQRAEASGECRAQGADSMRGRCSRAVHAWQRAGPSCLLAACVCHPRRF